MMHPTDPPNLAKDFADEGEPLGVFQNLPVVDLGARELADLKRSVHEMIHTRAVEAAIDAGDGAGNDVSMRSARGRELLRMTFRVVGAVRSASSSAGLRIAAAFGTVALATAFLVSAFAPQPLRVATQPVESYAPSRAELAEIEALPLVENLDGDTELIQIEDDEMSLVVAAVR